MQYVMNQVRGMATFLLEGEAPTRVLHVPGVILTGAVRSWRGFLGLETKMPVPASCTNAVQPQ
jgi:hypothetical protein